jgi:hypothetical protein
MLKGRPEGRVRALLPPAARDRGRVPWARGFDELRVDRRGEPADGKSEVFGASSQAQLTVRAARLPEALRRRENWVQLVKFGIVGASGYVVNLAVYALLLKEAGLYYVAAATGSFLVAARLGCASQSVGSL